MRWARGFGLLSGCSWGCTCLLTCPMVCLHLPVTHLVLCIMNTACMFMYIAASASSRSSLGTTNGLAQLTASSMRALAPSAASSLFSLSLELKGNHTPGQGIVSILGGYLVYLVLGAISIGAVGWGVWLPKELETRQENEAIVD